MELFALSIIVTYLYAIYLIVLRLKISHQSIRVFKILLVLFVLIDFILLFTNPLVGYELVAQILFLVPLPFMLFATYVNEFKTIFKRIGLFGKQAQKEATDNELADQLIDTIDFLANRKVGALITIERNTDLSALVSKALMINAPVSSELLASIFIPTTPLHDGAVIIRKGRILCAKAYYPSTERTDLPLKFGTRHRAAIGISEQSDALTVVVSEETGHVSVTLNRQIDYNVSKETLSLYFEKYLKIK